MTDRREDQPETVLHRVAGQPNPEIDLAGAALALAQLDRARVSPDRYHAHLARLVEEARAERETRGAPATPRARECAEILACVLHERNGYAGDQLTYDDPQNANLIRAIDRRKGLPVTLGILYIHTARGLGWAAEGLNFPDHFLVRVAGADGRAIVDPFHGGRSLGAAELRQLLKSLSGPSAELAPADTEAVGNRNILLRLQNNIKLGFLRLAQIEEALGTVNRMLLFAPDAPEVWRDAGTLNTRLDNVRAAIGALEQFVRRCPGDRSRYRTSMFIQELRNRLN